MSWGPIPIAPQMIVSGPNVALGGLNTAASQPLAMTAAGTTHTKGAWTELFTSTTFDATMLELILQATGTSGFSRHMLCDVGIGAAGSETVIVPNIAVGTASSIRKYTLPIWVPSGSRIAVRLQSNTASVSVNTQMVISNTGHTQSDTGASAVSIGTSTATSTGTALTLASVANTVSAWTQITAATASDLRGLLVSAQGPTAGSWSSNNDVLVDIGYGGSGSEQILISGLYLFWNTNELTDGTPITLPVDLPNGTRLVARYQGSTIAQAPVVSMVGFA